MYDQRVTSTWNRIGGGAATHSTNDMQKTASLASWSLSRYGVVDEWDDNAETPPSRLLICHDIAAVASPPIYNDRDRDSVRGDENWGLIRYKSVLIGSNNNIDYSCGGHNYDLNHYHEDFYFNASDHVTETRLICINAASNRLFTAKGPL